VHSTACLEPGAVLSEIARAAAIHVSQLFWWRKELCQIEEPRLESASTLMPVIVSEAATAIQPTATETPTEPQPCRKRSDVMIELDRCRRLRVDSDIDTEELGRILDCVLGRR
jgi:transposase